MKRQWKQMKPQKKLSPKNIDFSLCFHCQQRKIAGFWVFCEECSRLPECARVLYLVRKKYGRYIEGDI